MELSGFHQKSSGKIIVYQSMQNLYQLVDKQPELWMHVMSDVTMCVNITPLTIKDRLLINTLQTEKVELLKTSSSAIAERPRCHVSQF